MQDFIHETARSTPITHDVDLVIAGGGTSGVACAVCAARLGLRVLIIEQTAQPGGMVTGVTQWTGDAENKGGFVHEFFQYMAGKGITNPPYYNGFRLVTYFDRLLTGNGVIPLYLAKVAAPIMENGAIRGVIVESKQGRHAIRAKLVVDATGDGDVAAAAGADFEYGRPSDGRIQAISLSMTIQNFEPEKVHLKEELFPALRQIAPDYQLPYDNGFIRRLPATERTLVLGVSHVWDCDPLNAESLSRGLIELRRQSEELVELMRQTPYGSHLEGCGFSPLPGVRESRRIVCDAYVSDADFEQGNHYPDAIFTVNHSIDIHRCKDGEPAIIVEKVKPYQIRYGSLLPKKLDNLLVVGRCIGGSHRALASYRLIADCFAMGEAAALAAVQAIETGKSLRGISTAQLRETMEKRGYLL